MTFTIYILHQRKMNLEIAHSLICKFNTRKPGWIFKGMTCTVFLLLCPKTYIVFSFFFSLLRSLLLFLFCFIFLTLLFFRDDGARNQLFPHFVRASGTALKCCVPVKLWEKLQSILMLLCEVVLLLLLLLFFNDLCMHKHEFCHLSSFVRGGFVRSTASI